MKTMTLEQYYCSDYADFPEELEINLVPDLYYLLSKGKDILSLHKEIRDISFTVPDGLLEITDEQYEACPFDVVKLCVYSHDMAVIYMQGKYDCSLQAEYGMTISNIIGQ